MPCAGAPHRAAAAAAGQHHAHAKDDAAHQTALPEGGAHKGVYFFKKGEFNEHKTHNAYDQSQQHGFGVGGIPGNKGVTKGAHETDAGALGNDAEQDAEQKDDGQAAISQPGIGDDGRQRQDEGNTADVQLLPGVVQISFCGTGGNFFHFPNEVAGAQKGADN